MWKEQHRASQKERAGQGWGSPVEDRGQFGLGKTQLQLPKELQLEWVLLLWTQALPINSKLVRRSMQVKRTHFALARDSSCKWSSQISDAVQRASFHPSASFSARSHFGDKTPSGLTSQPVIPAVQTKHTDCQSKQTSLLTTKFCLHNFSPVKKKITKYKAHSIPSGIHCGGESRILWKSSWLHF